MTAVKEKNWLSDFDLHLFGEGKHYSIYEKLGAHLTERKGQSGVYFAVWAPHAQEVWVGSLLFKNRSLWLPTGATSSNSINCDRFILLLAGRILVSSPFPS